MTEHSSTGQQAHADTIQRLQAALAEFTPGQQDFFDHELERKKSKVREQAMRLLTQRARSRQELQDRLLAREHDPRLVEEVLEDLSHVGLLNDAEFAVTWVRQRRSMRGKSKAALARELRDKGVVEHIIQDVLAEIVPDDEYQLAYKVARKKVQTIREIPTDYQARVKYLRRIHGTLARRGFGAGLAMSIAEQVLDERITELETNT